MTLLIYQLEKHTITVVTDTLASSETAPDSYVHKFRVAENGRYIVAGMGAGNLIAPWLTDVGEASFATMDEVTRFSAEVLPGRWAAVQDEFGASANYATAYVFGFRNGKATRVSLSSRDGFNVERARPQRIAIRPALPPALLQQLAIYTDGTDEDLMAIARHVTAYTREQPNGVPIGGEVIAARINSRGRRTVTPLGTLDPQIPDRI